ncbi:MAG: hypothetical protein WD208_03870 [Dehalococcoidia bacterium]
MHNNRGRMIFACLSIAESALIYAALGILGVVFGFGGSPLPWLAVLALMSLGMLVGWATAGARGDLATLAMIQGGVGVVAVYVAMATSPSHGGGFDMAWAVNLFGGDLQASQVAGSIFGLITATWLWRRAFTTIADRFPEERLMRDFRLGIAVIAVAVLTERISGEDLGTGILLVPFFAASLAGLAVARLPEEASGGAGGFWARIIAGSVVAVIGAGLALGLVGGLYGGGGVRLLYNGWGMIVDAMLWVLRYPLELVVYVMFAVLNWLRSMFSPEGEPTELEGPGGLPESTPSVGQGGSEDASAEAIVNVLQYPLLAITLIIVFIILALAFRKLVNREQSDRDEDRESIRGDADAAGDLARLFKRLLPSWLTGSGAAGLAWRYPEGDSGIVDVFRLYFDTLSLAVKRGMMFDPNLTPSERMPQLQAALPGVPVERVTERFNAACYGQEPTDPGTIQSLRDHLAEAQKRRQDTNTPSD